MSRVRTARLGWRRLRQTPATFANWPGLLTGMAAEAIGRGPAELTFRTRTGVTITVPNAPGARVPAYELFAEDSYDLEWFLGDLLDHPIHVLDVGAHVGTFSCRLARLHPDATIDCFEPSPDTVRYLERNVRDNHFEDRVTVHEKALAGETGFAVFDQRGAGSGHNRLERGEGVAGAAAKVATVSFDDVVAAARGPVELVKMDCEGGEYELVYRSSPERWADVQRLVLEFHPVAGQSWVDLRAWFADVGLHVVRHLIAPSGLGLAWLSRVPLDDPERPRRASRLGHLGYDARRVAQTPRAFENWPALLGGMARERVKRGPDTLTFVTRTGAVLTAPNVPGARLPAYEQFAEDAYRLPALLGELRDRPIHALDFGAHVGTFAIRLAQEHPGATVTCYEPAAETAGFLRANIERNGLADRIAVEESALTGEAGWALFDDHGGASVHSGLVRGTDAAAGTAVQVRTLGFDDAIAAAGRPVDLVKLDCEGGEYNLPSSSPESWRDVQRVVLEYHDVPDASWAELRAWFASIGLHLVAQRSEHTNLGLAWLSRSV